MQKKTLALILFLVVSIFSAASSYADEVIEVSEEEIIKEVDLFEGWNLIPLGKGIDFEMEQDFDDVLEAAYVYNPYSENFYDLLEEDDVLEDLIDELGYTAIWVYLNRDTEMILRVDLEEVQETVEDLNFEFVDGWNFYVVLPHMYKDYEGGYLNIGTDEYGDIYLAHDRLFVWDNRYKDWEGGQYSEIIEDDDIIDPEVIGLPIVMNYIDEFEVQYTPSFQNTVPDFPEI